MKYRVFTPQFHAPIRAGIKISTIRGKVWCRVGERVALRYWTGRPYGSKMGTIATAVVTEICAVELTSDVLALYENLIVNVHDGRNLGKHVMAKEEGFDSWQDMYRWFSEAHGLPYTGVLTRWEQKTLELVDVPQDGGNP